MLENIGNLLYRTIQQYVNPKKTSTALVPYVQGKQTSIGAGMHNKIPTDKQDSTRQFQSTRLIESAPLLPVSVEKMALQSSNHAISTRTANGEEMMRPEILLWHYPEKKNIVNGSPLIVASNQFCALKVRGLIFRVYETGQYRIRTPDVPFSSLAQPTFNDQSSFVENEALYVNRGQLVSKVSGVSISREKARVDYSVKYAIHLANRKDVLRLVQHMANQSHPLGQSKGLDMADINTAVRPVIERTVNKLVQLQYPLTDRRNEENSTSLPRPPDRSDCNGTMPNMSRGFALRPVESDQGQQTQDPSQLMHERLQSFLSTYGFTVDKVKVRIGSQPEEEIKKRPLSLKDFGLRRVETTGHVLAISKDATVQHLKPQQEKLGPEAQTNLQNRVNGHAGEMAVIPAELEGTRAGFGQRGVIHNVRLQAEPPRSGQL